MIAASCPLHGRAGGFKNFLKMKFWFLSLGRVKESFVGQLGEIKFWFLLLGKVS
jgi:hypothetical protein